MLNLLIWNLIRYALKLKILYSGVTKYASSLQQFFKIFDILVFVTIQVGYVHYGKLEAFVKLSETQKETRFFEKPVATHCKQGNEAAPYK